MGQSEEKQERNIRLGIPEKYWNLSERNQRAFMRIDEDIRRQKEIRLKAQEREKQQMADQEKRESDKKAEIELREKRNHELSIKEMDLQIEEKRAETMREMMAMVKEMNMSVEDMKKMMEGL